MATATVVRADQRKCEEVPFGSLAWFTSKAQGNCETLTTGIFVLNANNELPRHFHPNCDEVIYLFEGTVSQSFGDEEIEMNAGDVISVPAQVVHGTKNNSAKPARMVIIFSSADRETVMI